jgi:hypothetical protein
MPKFTVAVFTMDKLWNQLRYPSMDGSIKKMWYTYTIEFYLAIKKNEIMSFSGKWMELEIIMLSERPVPQRQLFHVCSHLWKLGGKQTQGHESRGDY